MSDNADFVPEQDEPELPFLSAHDALPWTRADSRGRSCPLVPLTGQRRQNPQNLADPGLSGVPCGARHEGHAEPVFR